MTSPEREPSAADRPRSSSHRRDRDMDDRRDAATAQRSTGAHYVPDDTTASYPEVPPPSGSGGRGRPRGDRADGPPPRRRRGAPPTLGLPVPPPPITKPFVSPDAPKPSGFVAPLDAGDGRPVSGTPDASDRARHRDVADPLRESGRHGTVGPDGRDAWVPGVTTGSHARIDD